MLFILVTSLVRYCVRIVGYWLLYEIASHRIARQNYSDGFVTFRGLLNDLHIKLYDMITC